MTPSNIVDIRSYNYRREDHFLLDTNIWLLIYGPDADPDDRRTKVYSAALKKMREYKSRIFLDAIILCEFVNRYAYWEFYLLNPTARSGEFKSFRKSTAFNPIAKDIALKTKRILNMTTCCDSGFNAMDINNILLKYETGGMDINDHILFEICKAKQLIFVTDDGDFKTTEIPILTINRVLLS